MTTYTYPTSPGFRSVNLKLNDPTITFRAQSGRRITRKVSGHLWGMTFTYPPMTKEQFRPVLGFLAKLRGVYNTFTVVPPNLATPIGTQTADTTVAASAAVGATAISLSGATALATFKAGDVVKFSNHTKVYMITDDATADGAGLASINVSPPLLSAVTITTTTAKHSNVPFTMALVNSLQEVEANVVGHYTYELDAEEVF